MPLTVRPDVVSSARELEGVGDEPGTVDVYHVPTAERVDAVDVGRQAGSVAFWKMEE